MKMRSSVSLASGQAGGVAGRSAGPGGCYSMQHAANSRSRACSTQVAETREGGRLKISSAHDVMRPPPICRLFVRRMCAHTMTSILCAPAFLISLTSRTANLKSTLPDLDACSSDVTVAPPIGRDWSTSRHWSGSRAYHEKISLTLPRDPRDPHETIMRHNSGWQRGMQQWHAY